MKVTDFEYYLPDELIAQEPAPVRDESRLMVLRKNGGEPEHRLFKDIVEYIKPQDVLVINDTRVIPARLWGKKEGTGTTIEVLLLTRRDEHTWETLVRPGRRVPPGTNIIFDAELTGTVEAVVGEGCRLIKFQYQGVFEQLLDKLGVMPLPPYIRKQPADPKRYQTVYAREPGSAAAPTAGLHFTPELLQRIRDQGTSIVPVLLHVGLGTFRPVKVDEVARHRMHAEYYSVSVETARVINEARARGGRVIAVGTTTTRCLETAAREKGAVKPGAGWTEIFIYPGYHFQAVDGLVTNFHLPRSTLLMMVSALVGRERLLDAYARAVQLRYRFFSFGDAMLII
ncbi:tRNA preQ1(34) S-adenosylmethionine ribosyltransferase-isomerase QueA [Desulfallas thermosapovorans]|uniref:S-adenosylmethionine:tRNA ribosyltransferase-isomerase n=1 Tax=Desulfallas thermosapovorans DSM 6562 TaxID=1121431 RepID=A0A5S5A0C4_9FIRM|nr:tRNA preQ1(34) S-adenosylmethionine ribosyltransferase-isomerase QueA [Desulfallas thermosapovorans]TYO97940.1 S-adenosylmethionine--tRNA ribosyltransferase-isomerase [Desulfallas thermosapovorans DSM 6562]